MLGPGGLAPPAFQCLRFHLVEEAALPPQAIPSGTWAEKADPRERKRTLQNLGC